MGTRADIAAAERGLCKSRARAKLLIQEGKVLLNGKPLLKPSVQVEEQDVLTLCGGDFRYVGRGGFKMEGAFAHFPLHVAGKICLDVGASTGGFTDCLLQNGAAFVFAVDVGSGQLDSSLTCHPQVADLENTDIRHVTALPKIPEFAGIDVSFISLRLVLPAVYRLLSEQADCIALVKPQFEAGRARIGKHGIVKSAKVHVQVLEEILAFAQQTGFAVQGLCSSPIQGGSGNIEYLAHLTKGHPAPESVPDIRQVVRSAGLQG